MVRKETQIDDVLVTSNEATDPTDFHLLLCKDICKLINLRGGEKGATGCIKRDSIDQNEFVTRVRQSVNGPLLTLLSGAEISAENPLEQQKETFEDRSQGSQKAD